MGCGGSKFDSDGETVPVRIRPLLQKRFQEIKNRRRNGASLKSFRSGLSKKELLKDGVSNSDYDVVSSPPRISDGKSISSHEDAPKVSPALESEQLTKVSKDVNVEFDHNALKESSILTDHRGLKELPILTDHIALKEAPILKSPKVVPAPQTKNLKKEKSIKWNIKEEDKEAIEAMPTAILAAVKAIKTSVHVGDVKGEGNEEDDDDEIGRLSSINAECLCPGSPSFRVYFIESLANIKDDEDEDDDDDVDVDVDNDKRISKYKSHSPERRLSLKKTVHSKSSQILTANDDSGRELASHADKDDDSDKKSFEEDSSDANESGNSNADLEVKTQKKSKRGSRFRRVIPKPKTGAVKHLLNVKSCYNPSCAGYDNARLLANKADA